MIQFYNTLTRQLEPFTPIDPHNVRMYVCGPTVYDEAHLGHARCYITWDILYRFLQFAGYTVDYTRNITDVDDKILKRAAENGESPTELAVRFTERFHAVMAQLNVLPPTHEPRATEHVDHMLAIITQLINNRQAYTTPSGTVYYRTTAFSHYGNLCHQNLEDLQSGARVDVDPEKESPLDFALWKPAPAGDPLVWSSPSEWGGTGYGRPGWHIECSAMSHRILGEQIDVHAGGMDLIFPHHQNEIAQSEAFTGQAPFAKLWMHNGFVNVSGEKMSKSLGNFATVADLLTVYDTNTLRHFVLTHHYRSPMDFNDEALQASKNWVDKTVRNIRSLVNVNFGVLHSDALEAFQKETLTALNNPTDPHNSILTRFQKALNDDLNTPQALEALDKLLTSINSLGIFSGNATGLSKKEIDEQINQVHLARLPAIHAGLKYLLCLSHLLGFTFMPDTRKDLAPLDASLRTFFNQLGSVHQEPETTFDLINTILDIRSDARKNKHWIMSDEIRDKLHELGLIIEDKPDGSTGWSYSDDVFKTTP